MLAVIAQSVATSRLKTIARSPIQILIRRSTSAHAVRLRNAMASPSQTSAVDRRRWGRIGKIYDRADVHYVITSTSIEQISADYAGATPHIGQVA
jgi:hypothetical protein